MTRPRPRVVVTVGTPHACSNWRKNLLCTTTTPSFLLRISRLENWQNLSWNDFWIYVFEHNRSLVEAGVVNNNIFRPFYLDMAIPTVRRRVMGCQEICSSEWGAPPGYEPHPCWYVTTIREWHDIVFHGPVVEVFSVVLMGCCHAPFIFYLFRALRWSESCCCCCSPSVINSRSLLGTAVINCPTHLNSNLRVPISNHL